MISQHVREDTDYFTCLQTGKAMMGGGDKPWKTLVAKNCSHSQFCLSGFCFSRCACLRYFIEINTHTFFAWKSVLESFPNIQSRQDTHTWACCQCIYRHAHNPTINTSCGENAARLFLVLLVEKLLVAQKRSCRATLRKSVASFSFLHKNEYKIKKMSRQRQGWRRYVTWFFCVGHWHFVTFDRTKIHLSFGKNFLLVQFESSTDLPSDCGWLLSRIQGIFFRKLSCQLLQKTKRTLEVSQKELIKIAFIIQFGFISHTASLMQMLLSSSILCLSVSSSASCLALSAASMSFLAVWELSDSWEPASHGQNVTRVQKSSVYVCYDPVWVRVCVHARLGRIKCAHTCQPDRMFTGKWMEHFDKEFNIQWCVFVCFKKGAAEDKMPDAYPRRPDIAPVFFETLLKTSTPPSNLFMLSLHLLFKGIKLTLLSCIQYAVIILYDDDTSIKCTNHFN